MASQLPVASPKKPATAKVGASGKAALPPMPGQKRRRRGWIKWAIILPLVLLGSTYLLGRVLEPARIRLAKVPLVGASLFSRPVWPILWNKSAQTVDKTASEQQTGVFTATELAAAAELSRLEAQAADRLAQAEMKENDLVRREGDLAAREEALKRREAGIADQEVTLGKSIKEADSLKTTLEGQLRSEQDRVEIVRALKSSAALSMFAAMTDTEVLRILMYMDATEVAKLLSGMEAERATRLLLALRQTPSQSAP